MGLRIGEDGVYCQFMRYVTLREISLGLSFFICKQEVLCQSLDIIVRTGKSIQTHKLVHRKLWADVHVGYNPKSTIVLMVDLYTIQKNQPDP